MTYWQLISGKISLIFLWGNSLTLTLSEVIFLAVWGVCVLFIYTISLSIHCVSREGLTLLESNQQICDFYKWVIFKKQSHFGPQSKFLYDSLLEIHDGEDLWQWPRVEIRLNTFPRSTIPQKQFIIIIIIIIQLASLCT